MKQKLSNTLKLNFCFLKIIPILHPCYHPKLIWDVLKNGQKTSVSVLMRSYDYMYWKWSSKWKNGLHRYDINRTKQTHGHKHTKYKICLSIMMVMCNKQHLSNIWSWSLKKLRSTQADLKKSIAYKKSVYFNNNSNTNNNMPPTLARYSPHPRYTR